MAEVTGRETAGGEIVLSQNNYGKSEIRLVKVKRETDRHEVWDLDVAVALEGDFQAAHVEGDNSGLLATDTVPADAYYEYAPAPPDAIARAQRLAAICAAHGVHLPTAALHFPLREPAVRTVVTSARQPTQIRETIARMAEPVPDDLWAHLAAEGLLS